MKLTVLSFVFLSAAVAQTDSKPSPMNHSRQTARSEQVSQKPQPQSMQEAIAFERHKEAAAARQARLEAKHPSVTYNNNANREPQSTVQDEKAPGSKPGK